MTTMSKKSTSKDDQTKASPPHDTPHATDTHLPILDPITVPPLPQTNHHPQKNDPHETRNRNNSNSSSAGKSSLPSTFSDRTEHTCTTDKASNTASRHTPDQFRYNGPPREPQPASQPPTITPADIISDDGRSQHIADKITDSPDHADHRTSPSTSGTESSLQDTDSDDSTPSEPALDPPP